MIRRRSYFQNSRQQRPVELGSTLDGKVPTLTTRAEYKTWKPLTWAVYTIAIGLSFLIWCLSLLLKSYHGIGVPLYACVIILLAGGSYLLFGFRLLRAYWAIRPLKSQQEVCKELGVDSVELAEWAKEHGILPRYNINGQYYYNLEDFGDRVSLLRAASAPTAAPETLLRPAANDAPTPPETLLRPVDNTDLSARVTVSPKEYQPQIQTNRLA